MSKGFIYSDQGSLWGEREIVGFGTKDFYIEEIDRNTANEVIIRNHYSGKIYNGTYINLGVFVKGGLFGVLQFGYAMNPASGKSVVKGTANDEYLELNRMWLDDYCGKNSESKALSYAIKFIKNKHRKIKWIQSFADERCGGFGIVYQAANFDYFGEHISTFWELDDVWYHNSMMTRNPEQTPQAKFLQENKDKARSETLRQFRYIYFLDRREIKNCTHKKCEYPKHYNEDSKYGFTGTLKDIAC